MVISTTVKVFFKSKSSSIPSVQLSNSNVTNDPFLKATMFNNFFISISNLDSTNTTLPPIHYETESRLNSIKYCELEICDILKSLDPNKASGDNFGITGELDSWFSSYLSERKLRVVLDRFTASYGGL